MFRLLGAAVAAVALSCAGAVGAKTTVYEAFDTDLTGDWWSVTLADGGPRRYVTIEYSGLTLLEYSHVGSYFSGLFWYYSEFAGLSRRVA